MTKINSRLPAFLSLIFFLLFSHLIFLSTKRRQQKCPSSFHLFWRFLFRWTKFATCNDNNMAIGCSTKQTHGGEKKDVIGNRNENCKAKRKKTESFKMFLFFNFINYSIKNKSSYAHWLNDENWIIQSNRHHVMINECAPGPWACRV